MSHATGVTIRLLILAAGTVAAYFIADYIDFKILGLFITPDAQGRYTVDHTKGQGYATAIMTLANIAALLLLVAALLWAIYARRPVDRIVVIAGGYLVACLIAAILLFVSVTILSQLTPPPEGYRLNPFTRTGLEQFASSLSVVSWLGATIGLLALLPALPVIVHTERKRIRSLPYYLIAGALTGIASFALSLAVLFAPVLWAWLTSAGRIRPGGGQIVPVWSLMFVLPGLGAGFAYWLVAGRNAGHRRDVDVIPEPSGKSRAG